MSKKSKRCWWNRVNARLQYRDISLRINRSAVISLLHRLLHNPRVQLLLYSSFFSNATCYISAYFSPLAGFLLSFSPNVFLIFSNFFFFFVKEIITKTTLQLWTEMLLNTRKIVFVFIICTYILYYISH